MAWLKWPIELATGVDHSLPVYDQMESLRLDLHGDPARAKLVVCSDGNHHMALEQTLQAFARTYPDVEEIFYTTTPPRIALQIMRGGLQIGNFRLAVSPNVFISPPSVLDQLIAEGKMKASLPFMRSRGVVLLVPKENPKNISGLADLFRKDVKLFLSNPFTETISYQIYTDCLRRLAMHEGAMLDFLAHAPGQPDPDKLMYGEAIHHREAPQAIEDGRADVALVFYHLALRYQRIFPELFDFVWPSGSLGEQACDISHFNCGLIGDGGEWGKQLMAFLMSDEVTEIYSSHGLERAR
jgi:hypothetical protein